MHRGALQRRVDVLSDESALLRKPFELPVEQDMRVGQLAAAFRGEGEDRPGAALDVDPAVLARRTGQIVELVKLFLAGEHREAERFQHPCALVEGEFAQRWAAHVAGVAEHAAEIEAARAGHRYRRPVDRAREFSQGAVTGDPAVAFVI